nr:putative ribonuclease H-like domain-containing protein [Tanacetum cinerariifolium]
MHSFDLKNVVPTGVSTVCYVHNRVLVTKPHNKTLYELLIGRTPNLDFMKPFWCPVTILNTLDHLGMFKRKADEGFFVGYSISSKAFRYDIFGKTSIFDDVYDDREVGAEAEINNLELLTVNRSIPTTRVHKYHLKEQIIRDLNLAAQIRRTLNFSKENDMTLVDLSNGKRAIGTNWVFRNKKDVRGIVIRNKTRLVAQGYTQEKGIDYDEVFSPVARIKAIRIFLAYASLIGFIVHKMDVKSAFLYGTIEEEVQDKFVADILKKFDFTTVKIASTQMDPNKTLIKDAEAKNYPGDSPFDLEDFSDSDYARASLDRKSTTGGCQFLGKRLISWQCKKQTIVANSNTEAEYVTFTSCYGKVLWIQNQMLDFGFNIMNTKIYIDNESTICIVKNPVFHSKTKHIEIRHHFIRYSYEKKLIQVIKIHTDHNVADLLTKAFDVRKFNFLVASIILHNL